MLLLLQLLPPRRLQPPFHLSTQDRCTDRCTEEEDAAVVAAAAVAAVVGVDTVELPEADLRSSNAPAPLLRTMSATATCPRVVDVGGAILAASGTAAARMPATTTMPREGRSDRSGRRVERAVEQETEQDPEQETEQAALNSPASSSSNVPDNTRSFTRFTTRPNAAMHRPANAAQTGHAFSSARPASRTRDNVV